MKRIKRRIKYRKPFESHKFMVIISVIIGMFLFLINFIYIKFTLLYIVSIALVLIGPIVIEYIRYKENKGIEENFPNFLRDVSENIHAGMTLPQAIKSTKTTDYGPLSPYVKKMAVQIDWGVPFDEILESFSSKGTSVIRRTVSTIIETHKSGGKIAESLSAVGRSIMEINRIRKERASAIYSELVTGYVIFFVFLGIIVSLKSFLLPNMFVVASPELGITMTGSEIKVVFSEVFQWLILIQGFFSGLVIGKMSEGNLVAGLKHSLILLIVGYSVVLIF
jgi:flagellar protein FlaJ